MMLKHKFFTVEVETPGHSEVSIKCRSSVEFVLQVESFFCNLSSCSVRVECRSIFELVWQ